MWITARKRLPKPKRLPDACGQAVDNLRMPGDNRRRGKLSTKLSAIIPGVIGKLVHIIVHIA